MSAATEAPPDSRPWPFEVSDADPDLPRRQREAFAPRTRVWTPPEIWSPIEPQPFTLGTISRGDVVALVAHGDSLKSWIAINAVIAKASGRSWLEMFETAVAGDALYIDFEMGADECRRRMQRTSLAWGVVGPVDGVALVSMPDWRLNSPEGARELARLAEGRAIIAIDSLAAGQPDADENDARFADVLKREKEIGERTGCAFVNLHHARKSSKEGGDDERERVRGTSALFAATDVVYQLARYGEGAFLVKQTKARRGKKADPFVVRIDDVDGIEATRVYAAPPDETREAVVDASSALQRAKAAVLVVLGREHDIRSGNDIVRRCKGIGRPAVLAALKEHREHGLVVEHDGALRLASEVTP